LEAGAFLSKRKVLITTTTTTTKKPSTKKAIEPFIDLGVKQAPQQTFINPIVAKTKNPFADTPKFFDTISDALDLNPSSKSRSEMSRRASTGEGVKNLFYGAGAGLTFPIIALEQASENPLGTAKFLLNPPKDLIQQVAMANIIALQENPTQYMERLAGSLASGYVLGKGLGVVKKGYASYQLEKNAKPLTVGATSYVEVTPKKTGFTTKTKSVLTTKIDGQTYHAVSVGTGKSAPVKDMLLISEGGAERVFNLADKSNLYYSVSDDFVLAQSPSTYNAYPSAVKSSNINYVLKKGGYGVSGSTVTSQEPFYNVQTNVFEAGSVTRQTGKNSYFTYSEVYGTQLKGGKHLANVYETSFVTQKGGTPDASLFGGGASQGQASGTVQTYGVQLGVKGGVVKDFVQQAKTEFVSFQSYWSGTKGAGSGATLNVASQGLKTSSKTEKTVLPTLNAKTGTSKTTTETVTLPSKQKIDLFEATKSRLSLGVGSGVGSSKKIDQAGAYSFAPKSKTKTNIKSDVKTDFDLKPDTKTNIKADITQKSKDKQDFDLIGGTSQVFDAGTTPRQDTKEKLAVAVSVKSKSKTTQAHKTSTVTDFFNPSGGTGNFKSYGFGSGSKAYTFRRARKVKRKPAKSSRSPFSINPKADLLSVTQSQGRFGSATHLKPTKRVKRAFTKRIGRGGLRFPTAEIGLEVKSKKKSKKKKKKKGWRFL